MKDISPTHKVGRKWDCLVCSRLFPTKDKALLHFQAKHTFQEESFLEKLSALESLAIKEGWSVAGFAEKVREMLKLQGHLEHMDKQVGRAVERLGDV